MRLKHFLISLFFALAFTSTTLSANTETTHSTVKTQEQLIQEEQNSYESKSVGGLLVSFFQTTGLNAILNPKDGVKNGAGVEMSRFAQSWGRVIMFIIIFLLFYLAIAKGFEPLLLLPIAFGGLLANIPIANMTGPHGMLGIIYNMGIANEFFPLLIFMGVGAMTDFGQLLANQKTALQGGGGKRN